VEDGGSVNEYDPLTSRSGPMCARQVNDRRSDRSPTEPAGQRMLVGNTSNTERETRREKRQNTSDRKRVAIRAIRVVAALAVYHWIEGKLGGEAVGVPLAWHPLKPAAEVGGSSISRRRFN